MQCPQSVAVLDRLSVESCRDLSPLQGRIALKLNDTFLGHFLMQYLRPGRVNTRLVSYSLLSSKWIWADAAPTRYTQLQVSCMNDLGTGFCFFGISSISFPRR
jgi:hypothetical protein